MFSKIRNNFKPLSNYSIFSEYIIKTNHNYNNSIKKDCENYVFKKNMRELINKNNDSSIIKCCNDSTSGFTLFTITTFSIGLYTFLYFYRCKK
uniref:Uncharacterized protein n=1 Tax=viral metagenome TaxID=1070528 RepID=A0A6C0IGB3_9ZZZZ